MIVGAVSEGVKDIDFENGLITYGDVEVEPWEEGLLTAIAFLVGAFCSALAGYIGMYIAVRSNFRTASAATRSLKEAITVSLRGGAVSGFLVVALSLIGVSSIFLLYTEVLGNSKDIAPFLIVGFGFGASFVALFAQLGGGIYTKAADVGADLVGKVEAGIPEDDPRNAAVVADLVGDNVGDCAGRGADLFESMSAENIGAMILGVAIYAVTGDLEWIIFPLVLRSFGIFATIVGLTSVPFFARDDGKQNPMTPLNYGYYIVSCAVGRRSRHRHQGDARRRVVLVLLLRPHRHRDRHRLRLHHAVLHVRRLAAGQGDRRRLAHRPGDEHHHRHRRRPRDDGRHGDRHRHRARRVVRPRFRSRHRRRRTGFTTGVFGTAVATMGMLMSAAYILAMDTFGPITDNAGGITEMSGAPESARHITDALDSVGNTTKALTKGYAVASAGLAAFLLFSAYLDKVKERLGLPLNQELPIDLANVDVFVGGLIGVMLVFVFSLARDPRRRLGGRRHHRRSAPPVPRRPRHHGRHLPPGLRPRGRHHRQGRPAQHDRRRASSRSACRSSSAWSSASSAASDYGELEDASGWLAVSGMLMIGTIVGILHGHLLQQRRWRLGQRQEVHRGRAT